MRAELTFGIITTIFGVFIGFFGNYLIAKFNARNELKKSISGYRAKYYLQLWKSCDRDISTQEKQKERFKEISKWYNKGGGLLLPFKATDRLIGALNILEKSTERKLQADELIQLMENLSWLRTEMKYEVGSYSRKEANKILPNIRNRIN